MNYGLWHSIATVLAVVAFAGVCWWAYSPANRKRFEQDALMPLDTDPLHQQRTQGAQQPSGKDDLGENAR